MLALFSTQHGHALVHQRLVVTGIRVGVPTQV
jgi:hypothetical protein